MKVSSKTTIWLDGSSILRSGIPLDYSRLCDSLLAKLGKGQEAWNGRYYDYALPEIDAKAGANLSRAEDREQLLWQREEQRRAEAAGFGLHLSPAWCEKLRCRFCSCLNAVRYPAPPLLDLQGDLQWDSPAADNAKHCESSQVSSPKIFLLSDNPALLFSLSKIRSDGSSFLKQSALRLLCIEGGWGNLELLEKYSKAWPADQRQILEAGLQNAARLELEDVEWPED